MIEVEFETADFEYRARQLGGALDQVPFALSVALNRAATNARLALVQDTWPRHVTMRSRNFIRWALRVVYSTKQHLRIEINDEAAQTRGHLLLHAIGGVKSGRRRLAIPPKGSVVRTARGVRKDQTPSAIIATTPKRALRITASGIFVGARGRLTLKYLFRQSVRQPADVPFAEDFGDALRGEVRASFPAALAEAMRTRR
jgi:hypothetical protein